MAVNTYDEGEIVTMGAVFRDESGNLIDPDVVNFTYKAGTTGPIFTVSTPDPSIVRLSQGTYEVDASSTGYPGDWPYRPWSTGRGQTAARGLLRVRPKPC